MEFGEMALGVGKSRDRGLTLRVPHHEMQEREQHVHMQPQVVVPSFFLCPISLELMRDPVTLSTGMTFDRASIEKWLGFGHNTCPATNQALESSRPELIPNHTLRRLIQSWCVANQAHGVERIPTPKAPVEPRTVHQLLAQIAQCEPEPQAVRELLRFAQECERNRKCIADAGAGPVLAGALAQLGTNMDSGMSMAMDVDSRGYCSRANRLEACEGALATIALLQLGEGDRKALAMPRTLACLGVVLKAGGVEAKVNAADVIWSVCEEDPRVKVVVGDLPGGIEALVALLKEDSSQRAVQSGLRCLLCVCLPRRNRVTAIECRAISVLVELLPRAEKRNKELAFAVLEILANCAEGREAISNHALAIPMIVKSMVGLSQRATEYAVSALWVVLSYASNRSVINTALQAGAFANLLMLLPSECSPRAKYKARDSLKLLNEVWGSYTCRPPEDEVRIVDRRDMGQLRFSTGLV